MTWYEFGLQWRRKCRQDKTRPVSRADSCCCSVLRLCRGMGLVRHAWDDVPSGRGACGNCHRHPHRLSRDGRVRVQLPSDAPARHGSGRGVRLHDGGVRGGSRLPARMVPLAHLRRDLVGECDSARPLGALPLRRRAAVRLSLHDGRVRGVLRRSHGVRRRDGALRRGVPVPQAARRLA